MLPKMKIPRNPPNVSCWCWFLPPKNFPVESASSAKRVRRLCGSEAGLLLGATGVYGPPSPGVLGVPLAPGDQPAPGKPENEHRPIQFQRRVYWVLGAYWFGAPGVGTLPETCAPLACALVNAAMRLMPLPETCAPSAWASVNGVETVIEPLLRPPPKPPKPPRPPVTEATTAVSRFVPLSMVMVWPEPKPAALATGMAVAPA